MSVILHFIRLVIWSTRIVHRHDECAIERFANSLPIELLRGICSCRSKRPTLLVLESISKLLYRFAKCQTQHVIHRTQHFLLTLLNSLLRLTISNHLTQFQPELPQLGCYQTCGSRRIFCRISLGLRLHRHQSVLLREVGHATEGAAITNRTLEEEAYTFVLHRQFSIINDTLQHQVRLLQLVIEEQIVL